MRAFIDSQRTRTSLNYKYSRKRSMQTGVRYLLIDYVRSPIDTCGRNRNEKCDIHANCVYTYIGYRFEHHIYWIYVIGGRAYTCDCVSAYQTCLSILLLISYFLNIIIQWNCCKLKRSFGEMLQLLALKYQIPWIISTYIQYFTECYIFKLSKFHCIRRYFIFIGIFRYSENKSMLLQ